MTFEIEVPAGIQVPTEFELAYDNPTSAKDDLRELQIAFPHQKFQVIRDGTPISEDELDAEIRLSEIAQVRESSCGLPSTYRRGWSNTTDEIAKGPDGKPTKVWDPENPEDKFDSPFRPKRGQ